MQDFSHNPTHIENGSYRADVLRGGTIDPFWYYVIRRKDSLEITYIAKFDNYEQAMEAARETLAKMNAKATAS